MKRILTLMVCMGIIFVGCGNNEYEANSYTLKNNFNEEYIVEYTEYSGFPDTNVRITAYYSGKEIMEYSGEYKRVEQLKPQKILHLCSTQKCDFYFMKNKYSEYIFTDGQMDWNFHDNIAEINQNYIESEMFEINKEGYLELSKELQENTDEASLIKRLKTCGCNYSDVINIYNLYS